MSLDINMARGVPQTPTFNDPLQQASAASATAGSWVTMMTHRSFSCASFCMISMIIRLFSLSRLPVGSSAKMISLPEVKARAMATRCCSPPESMVGSRLN